MHLGVILVLLGITLAAPLRSIPYLSSAMFHFQMLMLAPLLLLYRRLSFKIVFFAGVMLAALYPLASHKLAVYFSLRPEAAAQSLFILLFLLPFVYFAGRPGLLLFSILAPTISLAALFFGTDRVLQLS